MGLVPYDNCKDHELLATTGAHWLLHCHAPALLAASLFFYKKHTSLLLAALPSPLGCSTAVFLSRCCMCVRECVCERVSVPFPLLCDGCNEFYPSPSDERGTVTRE
jgi:hypothetical protein